MLKDAKYALGKSAKLILDESQIEEMKLLLTNSLANQQLLRLLLGRMSILIRDGFDTSTLIEFFHITKVLVK